MPARGCVCRGMWLCDPTGVPGAGPGRTGPPASSTRVLPGALACGQVLGVVARPRRRPREPWHRSFAFRTIGRPPHRWVVRLKCRSSSPAMSHVIPLPVCQELKFDRWNCNVCGLSRKMTALNYVRLLEGAVTAVTLGPLYRPRAPRPGAPVRSPSAVSRFVPCATFLNRAVMGGLQH